ncbi:hypothetical protein MKW94_029870 [Papaver nudicaule]|uniref:F-box associated beta-propeller type 3 domain-containing protein n=1 Tax=Papaver nudicaule TaxID=74823 RepID=A0AA41VVV8_PAPNU|nr:hypothetical protein [Papaver nudicaule]
MGSSRYSDLIHGEEENHNNRKRKTLIYSDLLEEEKEDYKKQRTGEVQMDDLFSISLPDELILEFLSRLPMKSLMRFSTVWNFTTYELLRIYPPVIEHQGKGFNYKVLACGFGFDSFRKEYKLVFIVRMLYTMSIKCWVYRFGTKSSWEEISAPDVSRDPRSSHRSEDMFYRVATFTSYGGAGGGGALFWRTINPRLILLFDLHQEKFQYIQSPVGGGKQSPAADDIRFFEHKGYLVVATLVKKAPVAVRRSGIEIKISTLEKVHLNILKSYKDDQVWVKETVDLSPYPIPYLNQHCRLVSFCDQVLLYWMEPKRFQFFNLHTKCRKEVRNLASSIIQKTPFRDLMAHDYRLNCEVENIFSLKTLLPKRAQRCDAAAMDAIVKKGFGHIWSLKEPKTVGGYFKSCSQSKAKEYFVFGD